jgi:hypothetical protein
MTNLPAKWIHDLEAWTQQMHVAEVTNKLKRSGASFLERLN